MFLIALVILRKSLFLNLSKNEALADIKLFLQKSEFYQKILSQREIPQNLYLSAMALYFSTFSLQWGSIRGGVQIEGGAIFSY